MSTTCGAHVLCPSVLYVPRRLSCDRMKVVHPAVIHPHQLPTISRSSLQNLQVGVILCQLWGCLRPQAPGNSIATPQHCPRQEPGDSQWIPTVCCC